MEKSAGWIRNGLNYRKSQIEQKMHYSSGQVINVDWLSGCNLIFKPSGFCAQLRFNSSFPLYFEDIDFCLRAKASGGTCLWLNHLIITHRQGTGSQCSSFRRERLKSISQVRFLAKYQPLWVAILHTLRLLITAMLLMPRDINKSASMASVSLLRWSLARNL